MVSPYGWHEITPEELRMVRDRLSNFESMTWSEILVQGRKQHHTVKLHKLSNAARQRLEEIFGAIDVDFLVSLSLGSVERIWGVLDGRVLQVLWWDPGHQVYPSKLKHT